jgi:hypothetical protein
MRVVGQLGGDQTTPNAKMGWPGGGFGGVVWPLAWPLGGGLATSPFWPFMGGQSGVTEPMAFGVVRPQGPTLSFFF